MGDEGSFDRCADLPVEPDDGVEREQSLHDAGPQPRRDAAVVVFEAKLVLGGLEGNLRPSHLHRILDATNEALTQHLDDYKCASAVITGIALKELAP